MKATTRARITAQVKIVILTIANVIGGSNAILVILYRTLKPQCPKGVYQTLILQLVKSETAIDILTLLVHAVYPDTSVHTEIGRIDLFHYLLL